MFQEGCPALTAVLWVGRRMEGGGTSQSLPRHGPLSAAPPEGHHRDSRAQDPRGVNLDGPLPAALGHFLRGGLHQ